MGHPRTDGAARPQRAAVYAAATTGVLAVLAYAWIYGSGLAPTPVRSDAVSYYVYLPAVFIHGDPSLTALAADCCGGQFPAYTAIIRWPATGAWVNAHPIGVAVLVSPFFALADLLARWGNLPRDGFWGLHTHLSGLAGPAYLVVGLLLVARVLTRTFRPRVVAATVVVLAFGTNLFHYATWDSLYSHVYAFCLLAALMAVLPAFYEAPSARTAAIVGALCGLLLLVRHTNALLLLVVPLYGLVDGAALRRRLGWAWQNRGVLALTAATAACTVLPQLWLYHRATGRWLVSSYGHLWFRFDNPRIVAVLFSTQKGLFFWSPLLLVALAGVLVTRGGARAWVPPLLVIFPIQTYLVASWHDWQFGASYGHRAFTDDLALFAVPLGASLDWIVDSRQHRWALGLVALLVLLSAAQMIQVWLGIMPMADVTWARYRALFLRFS
jgi:hypothetical protein